MADTLPFDDLERAFDLIADAIDDVGEQHETLFLSKLALALVHRIGDFSDIESAVETARRNLDG